jgi:hypothetical protein
MNFILASLRIARSPGPADACKAAREASLPPAGPQDSFPALAGSNIPNAFHPLGPGRWIIYINQIGNIEVIR